LLRVSHLSKQYKTANGNFLTVLDDVSFDIGAGDTFAIVGPSGSGKTTLLGLCAGLDRASSGTVELNGVALENLDEDQRAALRNQYVGFVFQNFQLIPTLTALENVMVPLELMGLPKWGLNNASTTIPPNFLAANNNAFVSPVPFPTNPKSCSPTSLRATWMWTTPVGSLTSSLS
jgi:predicted ABC-type transport system involved in lysophospholipase L1 biosynthesis ATPase subunit